MTSGGAGAPAQTSDDGRERSALRQTLFQGIPLSVLAVLTVALVAGWFPALVVGLLATWWALIASAQILALEVAALHALLKQREGDPS